MIYLIRTSPLALAACETEASAARYPDYERVDAATFRAVWRMRDARDMRQMRSVAEVEMRSATIRRAIERMQTRRWPLTPIGEFV